MTSTPLDAVFSIPELADHIARYLRPVQLSRLRLVSKTLYAAYQPQVSIPLQKDLLTVSSSAAVDPAHTVLCPFGVPAYRINKLSLRIDDKTTAQSLSQVLAIRPQPPALQVDHDGVNLRIYESIFASTKDLVSLTVIFRQRVVIDRYLHYIIEANLERLQTLKIECKESGPPTHVDWKLFRSLLEMTQRSLTALELGGLLLCPKTQGVYRELIEDQEADSWTTGSASLTFPKLQSLTLKNGEISNARIKVFSQLFPKLSTLVLNGCSGDWLPALMEDPLPDAVQEQLDKQLLDHALFPELRSLKIWLVFQSGKKRLLDLALGRKHLHTIGTDILPQSREGIKQLAEHCSKTGHRFRALTMQTYLTGGTPVEDLEAFYSAECFKHLEYVYMQTWDHTLKMFPFANTLTSLHLGGKVDLVVAPYVSTMNKILRHLPFLEVLIIERLLQGYDVFEGLGRDVTSTVKEIGLETPLVEKQGTAIAPPDWLNERPFLHELQFFASSPPPAAGPTHSLNNPLDLDELTRSAIQRFRFLEKLHVKSSFRHLPQEHLVEPWKATLPEGLKVEFSSMR
ncbi:hypothetical protein BGZ94_008083 [Podila epigama]|nr:hypothetical protein BGZ94_008083 [Podila epigama]